MHAVIPFLLRHGYWVLVANVFAEGIGLPIPALPVLLGMGALAGLGNFSIWTSLALAVAAALTSDVIWFRLGRVRGHSILNLLCRMSLEPDSCVSNTKSLFGRLGARALLIAKFVPGLELPLRRWPGLTRMNPWKFIAADATGAAVWSATYLAAGYVFRNQLELAAEQAGRMGSFLLLLIGGVLGSYVGWKYYQRRRFIRGPACSAHHARRTDDDDHSGRSHRSGGSASRIGSGERHRQAAGRNLDALDENWRAATRRSRATRTWSSIVLDRTKPPAPVRRCNYCVKE